MGEVGMVFAFLNAVLLAGASIFSRRGLENESFEVLLLISLVVATPIFLVLTSLTTGFAEAPMNGVVLAAVGAVLGSVLGRSLYFLSINYLGPGKSLSIIATSPIYAALLAVVVLGEEVTALVVAGTIGIVLGIVGISGDVRTETRRSDNTILVLVFPLVGAVLLAGAVTVRKLALNTGLAPIETGAINMVVALSVVTPLVAAKRGKDLLNADRYAVKNFLVASLLMAFAFLFYFFGLRITPASIFFPIVQTQPLFAVVFSALFLRELEVITTRTLLGSALVVGGASLVVLG